MLSSINSQFMHAMGSYFQQERYSTMHNVAVSFYKDAHDKIKKEIRAHVDEGMKNAKSQQALKFYTEIDKGLKKAGI